MSTAFFNTYPVRPFCLQGRHSLFALLLVLIAFPGVTIAQSSITREVTITYQSGNTAQFGFTEASVSVRYMFMRCAGDLYIHYELIPESVRTGIGYIYEGKGYPVSANRPERVNTVLFAGTVFSSAGLGSFSDSHAGAYSGAGCVGQSKPIRDGDRRFKVPGNTNASAEDWLRSVSISQLEQPPPLRNSEIEREIKQRLNEEQREREETERAREAAEREEREEARRQARADSLATEQERIERRTNAEEAARREAEEIAQWERQITLNRDERAEVARRVEVARVERERIAREREARERAERVARERAEREARERAKREQEANEQVEREREAREREERERAEQEQAATEGDRIVWVQCDVHVWRGQGTQMEHVFIEIFRYRSSTVGSIMGIFLRGGGVEEALGPGYRFVLSQPASQNSCKGYNSLAEAESAQNRMMSNPNTWPIKKTVRWTPSTTVTGIQK